MSIDPGQHFIDTFAPREKPWTHEMWFVGSVQRSLRLYREGLITAEEFANVIGNDLRVLDIRTENEKWGPE